ncbi:NADP-dependent oxidoreductase [Nocardioides sp. AN3]
MQAVVFHAFGGPDVLRVLDRPEPVPGPGEVRVAIAAAAVHRFDLLTRSGAIVRAGMVPAPERGFEWGLGWDFAGVVDAAGDGVDIAAGQPVIGMQPAIGVPTGAQATKVVVPSTSVAPAPDGIGAVAAATLPLDGLTAITAFEAAQLEAGSHLLVLGGAGGVGFFAVQLAVRAGVRVTATANDADAGGVRALGAEVVGRDELVNGVDAVLDTPGLGAAALEPVRDGGTLVTVAGPVEPVRGIRSVQVRVSQLEQRSRRLAELAELAASDSLVLPAASTLGLEDVGQAHEQLAAGGVGGRLVLVPR